MKVLILEGSPRIKGNSAILCDEFERGATESGCKVEKIHITRKKQAVVWDAMLVRKTAELAFRKTI